MNWQDLLFIEQDKPYFKTLMAYVQSQRDSGVKVFPPKEDVLNAFLLTPAEKVKVVILGQDPYHGAGQAHGLSFSVLKGNKIPPSLRNIYKELDGDFESFYIPEHGNLSNWAKQGVLLLNSVLTVEEAHAHSHKGKGWETFTDNVIRYISVQTEGVIFLLWGKPAQKKSRLIDTNKHHVLISAHPSPLSAHRGFIGCKHFSQVNQILAELGEQPINWQIT